MSSLPQAGGNALISCIHAAHTKYESKLHDWQRVIEIVWRLLTKQDMGRFEEMCKEGLLGPGDYGLFKDWSAIDGLREAYIRIRDGSVLGGEIQAMNDEENFYDDGPYQARVCRFFLAYHQVVTYCWWLSFRPTHLEGYCKFEVSLEWVMFVALLLVFFLSNGWKFQLWYAHQASVNEARGLPLNVGLIGELIKNNGLGCEVAAEGFKGPALDPSTKGQDAK
jgi:hypothetical protein